MFGAQFIMTDEVLDCIVDLAHYNKIDNLATLQSQVSWRNCDCWGPDVLIIVKAHAPPVATPSRETLRPAENLLGPSTGHWLSPVPGSVGATPSSSKPHPKSRYRCGSCGSTTHIGKPSLLNLICPVTPIDYLLSTSSSASNHLCPKHKSCTGVGVVLNENVFRVIVGVPLSPCHLTHVLLFYR
ncbi:hypothetical protein H4582DRAFT_1823626 [Lactarius indigo]|nr:hypothetical protein H4582DRAFT_1823626 [Lactarius indigo]